MKTQPAFRLMGVLDCSCVSFLLSALPSSASSFYGPPCRSLLSKGEKADNFIDMARQKGGFDTFVTRESRVIRDWTFEGPKNYTMDVIGVIGVIM